MHLPSFLKPAPITHGLDGIPDEHSRDKSRRAIAALTGGVTIGLASLFPINEQIRRADEKAAKQRVDEAKDREQALRNIWKQPDGELLIGSTFTVEGDPFSPESASKSFEIQFVRSESGTVMLINGAKYALIAEDEIPIFKKKINAAIYVTAVIKDGNSLTVKGQGFAGIKPGESQWMPQSLLVACEQAALGSKKIPYGITRENGEVMNGFLERIEEQGELAAADAQETK